IPRDGRLWFYHVGRVYLGNVCQFPTSLSANDFIKMEFLHDAVAVDSL
ncbi:MAG: hypothetical protein CG439_2269, partial [Methylococcaceae bacterium NSP1-2]